MIIQSTPFRAVWGFEDEVTVRGYSVGAFIAKVAVARAQAEDD